MEKIVKIVDVTKRVKVGEKEVVTYKSLDGYTYSDKEECLRQDDMIRRREKRNKFNRESWMKSWTGRVFEIVNTIYLKDLEALKTFEELNYPNKKICHTFQIENFKGDWVVYKENIDYSLSVYFYEHMKEELEDLLKVLENTKEVK